MILDRFLYFLFHPSEYLGLWTLDATVLFSVLTLLVVLRNCIHLTAETSLMKHQDNLMQRQTEIVVRQDELLSRRARLRMYKDHSTRGQDQNFYWHLSVPVTVGGGEVWDGLGNQVQRSVSMVSHEERITVITPAWSTTPFIRLGMHLLSQNHKDPTIQLWRATPFRKTGQNRFRDGNIQRIKREESKSRGLRTP